MIIDLQQIALVGYLRAHNDLYCGKVLGLRQVVQNWLSYIPQTFSHYTRHTVQYTDDIVAQVSATMVVFTAHKTTESVYEHGLLNEGHIFVQWLICARDCRAQNAHGLMKEQHEWLASLLEVPIRHGGYQLPVLTTYLDGWRTLPGLPSDLYPPAVKPTPDMFVMKKEGNGDSSRQRVPGSD